MKVVIDIQDNLYNLIVSEEYRGNNTLEYAARRIQNGTPLPDDCEILTKEAYSDVCMRAAGGKMGSCYEALKESIAFVKRHIKSENNDYVTGYLCALSAVEGMIAEVQYLDEHE